MSSKIFQAYHRSSIQRNKVYSRHSNNYRKELWQEICNCLESWNKITSDRVIIDIVRNGLKIDFDCEPINDYVHNIPYKSDEIKINFYKKELSQYVKESKRIFYPLCLQEKRKMVTCVLHWTLDLMYSCINVWMYSKSYSQIAGWEVYI